MRFKLFAQILLVATLSLSVQPTYAQNTQPTKSSSPETKSEPQNATPQPSQDTPRGAVPLATTPIVLDPSQIKGALIGPGGRPLRADYPGTSTSLRASTLTPSELTSKLGKQKNNKNNMLENTEEQVQDLYNKLFAAKSKLVLLQEALMYDVIDGSRALFTFQNDLPPTNRIIQLSTTLDGVEIYNKGSKSPDLRLPAINIYEDALSPATHTIGILATIVSKATPPATSNIFDLTATCKLKLEPGKIAYLSILAANNPSSKQPAIRCATSIRTVSTVHPSSHNGRQK